MNFQLSATLGGARFHFIEMHTVSASDELVSCGQGDKVSIHHSNTGMQRRTVGIPTPSRELSVCAEFALVFRLASNFKLSTLQNHVTTKVE